MLIIFLLQEVKVLIVFYEQFLARFNQQDCDWTINGAQGSSPSLFSTLCGTDLYLYGGINVFRGDPIARTQITKTITDLPPHYLIQVSFQIYGFSWTGGSVVYKINNNIFTEAMNTVSTCAGNSQSNKAVTRLYSHSASSIQISITTNSVNTAQFWGIRNFKLEVQPCYATCATCNSGSSINCLSCPGVTYQQSWWISGPNIACGCLVPYLVQAYNSDITKCSGQICYSCVLSCLPGWYLSGNCLQCPSFCKVCSGTNNNPTDCTVCADGYYIQNAINHCQPCSGGCKTCSPSACYSCVVGKFFNSGTCIDGSSCPSSTFASQEFRQCFVCDTACLTCIGTTDSDCVICQVGKYRQPDFTCVGNCNPKYTNYARTDCVSTCGSNQYPDFATYFCQMCPPTCSACVSLTSCTACLSPNIPFISSCVPTCPPNSVNVVTSCQPCYSTCATCSGLANNNCLTCITGTTFYLGYCVVNCPLGQYMSGLSCLACPVQCSVCTTALVCNGCIALYKLHLNQSICTLSCPYPYDQSLSICWTCSPGMFGQGKLCFKCHPSCKQCFGGGWNQCKICNPNRGTPQPQLGSCLCKKGFYETGGQCLQKSVIGNYESAVYTFLIVSFALGMLLQILFYNSSGVLILVEFMQTLSYFGFLSMPLPLALENLFQMFYTSHPTSILTFGNKVLNHTQVAGYDTNLKFAMHGKSGFFLSDMAGVLIGCSIVVVTTIVFRGILKLSLNLNWQSHFVIKYLWHHFFPKVVVVFVNVTIMQTMLSCALAINSGNTFSLVCALICLVVILVSSLLVQTLEQWFLQPQVLYSEQPLQNYDQSRGVFFPIFCKIPIPFIIVFLQKSPITQLIIIFFINTSLLVSQFFIPYKRNVFRFMKIVQHATISVVSIGIFFANNLILGTASLYISIVGLIVGSIVLMGTEGALLLSNIGFILLQLKSYPAKLRYMFKLHEQNQTNLVTQQ